MEVAGFSNTEIEEALLSAVAQWPDDVIPQIMANGGTDLFTTTRSSTLFNAIHNLWSEGKRFDMIICSDYLEQHNALKPIGGAAWLAQVWFLCHAIEIVPYYIELLLDKTGRGKLKRACVATLKDAETPTQTLSEIVSEHQTKVSDIPVVGLAQEKTWPQMIAERWEVLSGKSDEEEIIQTGISFLDADSKMYKGSMPLIGGQRKSGKTTLALTILLNVAKRGVTVGFVTLEETVTAIMDRLLSAVARRPLHRRGDDLEHFQNAAQKLLMLPILITDSVRRTSQICSWCRDAVKHKNLGLLIVDYAQIVVPDSQNKDENREQRVAEVSRELRLLAKDCKIPIIVLSQLNAEHQTRESRSLEQDCTAMWRLDTVQDEPRLRELIIPFQRHGPSGIGTKLSFLGEICRVENYQSDAP